MRKLATIVLVVVCLLASAVAGDKPDTAISPYLLLQQTTLNNAKAVAYPGLVSEFKNIASSVNSENYWLAGSGITGNSYDLYFVSPLSNFAEVGKMMKSFEQVYQAIKVKNASLVDQFAEAEMVTRSSIWEYVPTLSYIPDKVDTAHATHWMVYTFHIKPGTMSSFSGLVHERADLIKKSNADEHWIAYRSVAGTDTAMMFVIPVASLSELDADNSMAMKSVMTPVVREHLESLVQQTTTKIESQLLMVRPELSRPNPQIVAANPDFWTVKEPVVSAEKKVKKAKKTEAEIGK